MQDTPSLTRIGRLNGRSDSRNAVTDAIGPDALLRILDCSPDASKWMDRILYGRAAEKRKDLARVLATCKDAALQDDLRATFNRLPDVFRTRILISSELGEWFHQKSIRIGKGDPSHNDFEALLELFHRESLVCALLINSPIDSSWIRAADEQIWSALGDWSAHRHGSEWHLKKLPVVGDIIAVDFDSPLASKHEARSGVLSQVRLDWTEQEQQIVLEKLNRAFSSIRQAVPNYHALIGNFTRRVIVRKSIDRVIDSDGRYRIYGSEHVARQPGSIRLLNVHLDNLTAAACMESLLHESVHNLLAAWETMNGPFVSSDKSYRPISPWSGNPIPNSSFVHSIFVYYACHNLFSAVLNGATRMSDRDMDRMKRRLPTFGVGFLTNHRLVDFLVVPQPIDPELAGTIDDVQTRMRSFYRSEGLRDGLLELGLTA